MAEYKMTEVILMSPSGIAGWAKPASSKAKWTSTCVNCGALLMRAPGRGRFAAALYWVHPVNFTLGEEMISYYSQQCIRREDFRP